MLNFSDDVLALNPQLSKPVVYRQKRERLLKDDDGFDSQLERDYLVELAARGWHVVPHPFTLHLPGGVDYTPDGIAWDDSYVIEIRVYECKGSIKAKNARDSRTRFKIAAGLFPCWPWVWVTRDRRGAWKEEVYKA
jgi:hypothetical protein